MENDKFWMSALWGRIGAAILLLVSFGLQQFGYEFTPDEQASFFDVIGSVIKDFGLLIAAAMAIMSKFRENKSKALPKMLWALLLILPMASSTVFIGCGPNQSATQQLLKQTNDPAIIALGSHYDALQLYVSAQDLYKPYAKYTDVRDPALAEKIRDNFSKAWALLQDWEKLGALPSGDVMEFRGYIRKILIDQKIASEGGN